MYLALKFSPPSNESFDVAQHSKGWGGRAPPAPEWYCFGCDDPPSYLLVKGVHGHFCPHGGVSALPKIYENTYEKRYFRQLGLCTLLQLLYLAVLQAGYGSQIMSYSQMHEYSYMYPHAVSCSCMHACIMYAYKQQL